MDFECKTDTIDRSRLVCRMKKNHGRIRRDSCTCIVSSQEMLSEEVSNSLVISGETSLSLSKMEDFSKPADYSKDTSVFGIFWDVQDFPFPNGCSPDEIYHKIESFVMGKVPGVYSISIWVYVDEKNAYWAKFLDSKSWNSRIFFLPGGDKVYRHHRMFMDVALWGSDLFKRVYSAYLLVVADDVIGNEEFVFRLKILYHGVYIAHPIQNVLTESSEWPKSILDKVYSVHAPVRSDSGC